MNVVADDLLKDGRRLVPDDGHEGLPGCFAAIVETIQLAARQQDDLVSESPAPTKPSLIALPLCDVGLVKADHPPRTSQLLVGGDLGVGNAHSMLENLLRRL